MDELSENIKEAVSLVVSEVNYALSDFEEEFDQEKTNGQRNQTTDQKPCINATRKF